MVSLKVFRFDHRVEEIREQNERDESDNHVFHISKSLAETSVQFADRKERDHNCDINDVRHVSTMKREAIPR